MHLFVSNISRDVKSDELRSLFEGIGEVISVKIISDRSSGESKGFGFVEMSDDSQALNAIQQLSQTDLGGRRLSISKARPKTSAPVRDFSRYWYSFTG